MRALADATNAAPRFKAGRQVLVPVLNVVLVWPDDVKAEAVP